jgi:hypothetical protein
MLKDLGLIPSPEKKERKEKKQRKRENCALNIFLRFTVLFLLSKRVGYPQKEENQEPIKYNDGDRDTWCK